MAILSHAEITEFLANLPDWKLEDSKLVRDYEFQNFGSAMAFVNQVAELSESLNHHPDIDIRYNKVRLSLISHDANGITSRDTRMASHISHDL